MSAGHITCANGSCQFAAMGTVSHADGHLSLDLWPGPVPNEPGAEVDPDMLCRHHLIDEAEQHMRLASRGSWAA